MSLLGLYVQVGPGTGCDRHAWLRLPYETFELNRRTCQLNWRTFKL